MMRWLFLLLFLLLLGLQYRLWVGPGSWAEVASLQRDLEKQQLANDRLKARNAILEKEINDLKTGLEGIEERARSQLGLIKEDETFILVVDDEQE